MNDNEQKFLNELDTKLWKAADKLRSSVDPGEYKDVVLGLIFIKYVSDAFDARREELKRLFADPESDYFLDSDDPEEINAELEIRDYYVADNIFWVPALGRWKMLQDNCRVTIGQQIEIKNGKTHIYEFKSTGRLIDDALDAIEKENPKLKGLLNKNYTRFQIDQEKLAGLIDLISSIPFEHATMKSKDILGHVYEYFLGQFALAEGKKGGQFYTPKAIVSLIVEILEPDHGRVFDPAMGSGGFFVQSERFLREHVGRIDTISIYGQESNPTTWRLAAMNMVIRGFGFDFGKKNADSFLDDQHPDLKADFVMANPPFNLKDWGGEQLQDDPRWVYGTPPAGNANFAWMQHMLYHLAYGGKMGLLLANGSMSSNTNNEGEIRKNLLEDDKVETIIALPGQLFTNTQIPACIWFLRKGEKPRPGEVLFIDARQMGYMKDRVLRDFSDEDIQKIAQTVHNWQKGGNYEDTAGFCRSAKLDEIRKNDYILTPGRYVGTVRDESDNLTFAEKMKPLVAEYNTQLKEAAILDAKIKANLLSLGFEVK